MDHTGGSSSYDNNPNHQRTDPISSIRCLDTDIQRTVDVVRTNAPELTNHLNNTYAYNTGLQPEGSLNDLVPLGSNQLDPSEDDAVKIIGLDEEEEEASFLPKTGTTFMSPAEQELEYWSNTHVLGYYIVETVVNSVCQKRISSNQFRSKEEQDVLIEYLSRGYQELLCYLLPQLVTISRLQSEKLSLQSTDYMEDIASIDGARNVSVTITDLDTFIALSRVISHKMKSLMRECRH